MAKLKTKFTTDQERRLKYAVVNMNQIPRDIRKKLYLCVKTNLKVCDGITESLLNEIHKITPIPKLKYDVLSLCFPSSEISLKSYWDFIGEEPDSDFDENKFDEFDMQGYKNRILFLQYLIDKL